MAIRRIFAAELEPRPIQLWGPMFNIQEKITTHFYTQYALRTLQVFAVFC